MAKNIFDPKHPRGIFNIFILVGALLAASSAVINFAFNNTKPQHVGLEKDSTAKTTYISLQRYKIMSGLVFSGLAFLLAAVLFVFGPLAYDAKEQFFFEVSPQREKCLKEQVSRNNYGEKRGCACCGKGTVGGIPPNYAEWLTTDKDTGSTWHRPDAVEQLPIEDESKPPCNNTTQTFSNAEEARCSSCTQPTYITYI